MIRVTFDNGTVREYEGCVWDIYDDGEEIAILGLNHFLPISRITKFEKQVKSLTKKEMFEYVKLEFKGCSAVLNVDEYGITISYYDNLKRSMRNLVFRNDDYIDITYLIKGE